MLTVLVAAAALSLDFARVAPSVRSAPDPITGMRVVVRVDGFDISTAEVTRGEYAEVMRLPAPTDPALPQSEVSWHDAIRFLNNLSVKQGLKPCYRPENGVRLAACDGYRLPTDAEWSRAAEVADPAGANLGLDSVAGDPQALLPLRPRAATGTGRIVDMTGNLWEWCEDWFHASGSPWPLHNPRGPLRGLAKVIRGGSYQTTRTRWAGGLRSSMDPAARSTRTGFRVVRPRREVAEFPAPDWLSYRIAPNPSTYSSMPPVSNVSREKWERFLGQPALRRDAPPRVRTLRQIEDPWLDGKLMEYETEPGIWEKLLILDATPQESGPKPLIIVPFYDVDTSAALDLGGRNFTNAPAIAFARHAAQMGYLAVAVRWWGESYGERYDEAVANLAARHPGTTGLGKWVWDSRRLLDYLVTLPQVDRQRIGMIGHSLGGKMTLYASALDERIRAAVVSDPGIPLASTNYQDYWYLGPKVKELPAGVDHQELIALIAPRSFLLIAGEADNEKSWAYLEAARPLFRDPSALGWIHHKTGHRPTLDSVASAWQWIAARLR